MEEDKSRKRRLIIIAVAIVVVMIAAILTLMAVRSGPAAVTDPNKDELLEPGEGTDFAVLYQSGDLFVVIDENEDIFRAIEKDMLLFAQTTMGEYKNPNTLVGFTFDNDFKKMEDTSVFTGQFSERADKIEVRVTGHGRGVYTLSITNLQDKTNIDDQLKMNGKRNEFIRSMPIEKGTYSIRYQLPLDRVVVSFYDGYTTKDIDDAVAFVEGGMGKAEGDDIVYNINKVGIVNLEQVRQNLVEPLPR